MDDVLMFRVDGPTRRSLLADERSVFFDAPLSRLSGGARPIS
jgi:hypothetical protein